jgi:hypothetical protein
VVFLNSPCRETPENVLKKCQETQSRLAAGGWAGLGFRKCTGGSVGKKMADGDGGPSDSDSDLGRFVAKALGTSEQLRAAWLLLVCRVIC